MADSKISALPASTTPLTGTEVLPIVQGGVTKQNSVANLTAGRAISATELTLTTGNLVPNTAARGIDFTANTPAAGMTSQLLNWYEEGTWTPNQGGGLIVVGVFSSGGRYTRIGRMVHINFYVGGTSSVAATSAANITSNLPFTCGTSKPFPVGMASNDANSSTNAVEGYAYTCVCSGSIAATAFIYVSMSYSVG